MLFEYVHTPAGSTSSRQACLACDEGREHFSAMEEEVEDWRCLGVLVSGGMREILHHADKRCAIARTISQSSARA